MSLSKNNRPVISDGQNGILEDRPHKVALGLYWRRPITQNATSEIRKASISDDDQGSEHGERVASEAVDAVFTATSNANDPTRVLALEKLRDSGFDDVHIGILSSPLAKRHDETAVMEAATFISRWIGDLNRLPVLDDKVAFDGDGVNVLDAGGHVELVECNEASWLEELADDAIWL